MAFVAAMGLVYAIITTMELTAQVNQYFFFFIVNIFENVILIHSKFEFDATFFYP
jgi:hypothetical protein